MNRSAFITGTDTGVGKTVVTCALLCALQARGLRVAPMKPVAAGAERIEGQWVNEDVRALLSSAGAPYPSELVNPMLLREPMAPHIAAAREGASIALAPLLAAYQALASQSDSVLVEGVGGFVVPLAPGLDTRDLAVALGLPVVLVVGLRLGCLNHALLTAEVIRRARLPLAGWVANVIDPHMAAQDENVAALVERLDAPLLGRIPHDVSADAKARAACIDPARARHLDW